MDTQNSGNPRLKIIDDPKGFSLAHEGGFFWVYVNGPLNPPELLCINSCWDWDGEDDKFSFAYGYIPSITSAWEAVDNNEHYVLRPGTFYTEVMAPESLKVEGDESYI